MPDTLTTRSPATSKLAAAMAALDPMQDAREAAIYACANLVAWLRADTLFMTSGANSGWRDRVTGQLFQPTIGGVNPSVQKIAGYNNQASLLFGSTAPTARPFSDAGGYLFPSGPVDHSLVVLGNGLAGSTGVLIGDDSPALTTTETCIQVNSGGTVSFYVGGQLEETSSTFTGGASPFLAISSFQYNGGAGAQLCDARISQSGSLQQALTRHSGVTSSPSLLGGCVVSAGGGGYSNGQTITLSNGAVVTIDTTSSGAVVLAHPTSAPTSRPTNPVTQVSTSGSGAGATFNFSYSQTLMLGGSFAGPALGIALAEAMVFNAPLLQGTLFTTNVTVTNPITGATSTKPLYGHIEDYMNARYGI